MQREDIYLKQLRQFTLFLAKLVGNDEVNTTELTEAENIDFLDEDILLYIRDDKPSEDISPKIKKLDEKMLKELLNHFLERYETTPTEGLKTKIISLSKVYSNVTSTYDLDLSNRISAI